MIKKGLLFLIIASGVILSSCSKYQQLLKSSNNELKYETALDLYEKKDYYRALQLFDDLKSVYRGTEKDRQISYLTAYSYYEQRDYILSSYYFKRFAKDFPDSDKAEESQFMSAYCYFKDSPRYSLDQTATVDAMKELQLFIDLYPQSDRIEECNNLIDDLRKKLEKKAYENAMLYYKIEDYIAAVVSFETMLDHFPDTKHREEVLFHILKSRYIFAGKSIESKKKERFELTLESYDSFIKSFPEGEYLKEANNIQKNSLKYFNN